MYVTSYDARTQTCALTLSWGCRCKPSPTVSSSYPGPPTLCPVLLTHTCDLRRFLLLQPLVFTFWAVPSSCQPSFAKAGILPTCTGPTLEHSQPTPCASPKKCDQGPKAEVLSENWRKCWNSRRFACAVQCWLVISMPSTLSVKLLLGQSCIKL